MKKKKILLGVLLATAAFGMAACTNTSKSDDDADKQTQTDEKRLEKAVRVNLSPAKYTPDQRVSKEAKSTLTSRT